MGSHDDARGDPESSEPRCRRPGWHRSAMADHSIQVCPCNRPCAQLDFDREHSSASSRRRCYRPSLERCEGRTLLTTYSVTALTDVGTGQGTSGDLRYCLLRANSDGQQDTITFAVTGTIQLGSSLPPLGNSRGITIAGPGATSLTVRGVGETSGFTILKVKHRATATFAGLTIADGHADQIGGGLFNYGKLTLTSVSFTGNSAQRKGGAIYNAGQLTISDSTLVNNSAGQSGGGLYTLGPATVTDSTISRNSAGNSGGGIETTYSTTKITGTTLDDNTAGVFGGGISVNAERFLHDKGGKLTLDDSTLSGNTVGRNDRHGFGGGLASNLSEIDIDGTSFTSNTAGRDAGGVGIDGVGSDAGTVSIAHSTFSGNTTGGSGGGILINGGPTVTKQTVDIQGASLTVASSTFVGNTAGRNGGGIEATLTGLEVKDTTLSDNSAGSSGGGISLESNSPLTQTHGTLTLVNSMLSGNGTARMAAASTIWIIWF